MKEHPVFHKAYQSSSGFRPMTRIAVPATRGFTLVEMAITLAVGGILLALALPSFTESRANGKIRAAAAQMQQDLQWARAEAIKRNATTTLILNSGPPCSWTVQDSGGNTLRQTSPDAFQANFNAVNCAATAATISFGSLGQPLGSGVLGSTFTFSNANTSITTRQWQVILAAGGRIVSRIVPGT